MIFNRYAFSIAALVLAACVLRQPPLNSRFFGDYTDFEKVDFKNDTVVYRHPVTRVTDYDRFMIAPVLVYSQPLKKIRESHRAPYDRLEAELQKKLAEIIGKGYDLVDEPGPGVLVLEYEVVDIKPYVWLTKPDGTRYFRADTLLKGSKFELDCRDSQSDERIFAISTQYAGEQYRAAENTALLPNIEGAFEDWARFLSGLLVEAKQKRRKDAAADAKAFRPSTSSYLADESHPGLLIYRHPRRRALDYDRFFMALPVIEGHKFASPQQQKEAQIRLRDKSAAVFKDEVKLVNQPGPGILSVRTRVEESTAGYKFSLECIDPNQGELVFGLIKPIGPMPLDDAYDRWNELLAERLDEAKEEDEEGQ